jgi:hypothetical protein
LSVKVRKKNILECNLGCDGAEAIALALQNGELGIPDDNTKAKNETLQILDLSGNQIPLSGMLKFAEKLIENKTIFCLKLNRTSSFPHTSTNEAHFNQSSIELRNFNHRFFVLV